MNCHLICLCCLWRQFNLIIAFATWPNASSKPSQPHWPNTHTHTHTCQITAVCVCVCAGEVKWQGWASDLQLPGIMNDGKHLKWNAQCKLSAHTQGERGERDGYGSALSCAIRRTNRGSKPRPFPLSPHAALLTAPPAVKCKCNLPRLARDVRWVIATLLQCCLCVRAYACVCARVCAPPLGVAVAQLCDHSMLPSSPHARVINWFLSGLRLFYSLLMTDDADTWAAATCPTAAAAAASPQQQHSQQRQQQRQSIIMLLIIIFVALCLHFFSIFKRLFYDWHFVFALALPLPFPYASSLPLLLLCFVLLLFLRIFAFICCPLSAPLLVYFWSLRSV